MACYPAIWSLFLSWIEYAHNSIVLAAIGITPFMASLCYQLPFYNCKEDEVVLHSIWQQVPSAVLCSSQQTQR